MPAPNDLQRASWLPGAVLRETQVLDRKKVTPEDKPPAPPPGPGPITERTIFVVAQWWVSRILTISLEMVVPGLLGVWADRNFGTSPLWTLVGFGVGLPLGFWHLLVITRLRK